MNDNNLYLGIDFGTTGLRIAVFNLDGKQVASSIQKYDTKIEKPGYATQNPLDWWNSLILATNDLLKQGIDPNNIKALAVDFHSCSVVLCNKDSSVLCDSLIWMDVRASKENNEINQKTNQELSAEWMPAKLLWLKRNEPKLYENAEVFCEALDWINYKLTNKWSININCSVNWGYNSDKKCFDYDFYETIGLKEAINKFPSENVYAVGDIISTLTKDAAKQLGLNENTIVACGGIDSSIGILGMNASSEGKLALCTGSSNLAMVLTKKPLFNTNGINIGPNHLIKGYYTDYRGQTAAGSIINWAKRNLYSELDDKDAYKIMDEKASSIPIGSDGLLVLDYFQGNKHPYLDGDVKGMIYGLSLSHTRDHIYRSLLEGICFETTHLLAQFEEKGRSIDEINLSGGLSKSDLFLSILSDITNKKINVPENSECSCLGSAIIAAYADKQYPDLISASNNMVKYSKVITPNLDNHKKYHKLFELYLQIYPKFSDFFKKVNETFKSI